MESSETVAPSPASDIPGIRGMLRRGEFAAALSAAQALLAETPAHRDALLFAAIAHRYLGHVADAQFALETLARHHPRFSRLHEERGHCFVLLKQAQPAIDAFLQAVNLNHALPASWSMLEGLYRMTGQRENSTMAANHVATLRKLPPEVVIATGLFMDGDLDAAEPMIRAFLLQHGDEVEAMRLLARIGIRRKVFEDAELLLSALLGMAPDYRAARAEYAETLIEMHKHAHARDELERLLREDAGNAHFYKSLYAAALVGLGEHERAVALYRELLAAAPGDADLHLSVAHALKTLGRRDDAIASYRQAASVRPAFGDAYWSLANLKTYRFTNEELARLKELQCAPDIATIDRYHLHFALGKALEDRGEYAGSFRYYELGNALKRAESNYRPEIIEKNTQQQIEVCTREFFAARADAGLAARDPIFIVGLPRSGSTLLEQILASHSQVEGTQELPNIQQIVGSLRGREPDPDNPRYPQVLTELPPAEFRSLGEQYIETTRVYRGGKAGAGPGIVPHFIDKMPNNFRHLGLIRLILPRARIIDARREPLACCFSNLKQLFAKGQEFTYSVEDIARYYRTYLELMRHWDAVLPGWILRVHHEDVVDDLEDSVRRILDFCELEFEPRCIEFHKTVRSVRTASSEQVRQPIYRDGLDQWRNFEPWLGPLKEALGDALHRYRDV
jgi:tetratricopeptide (TPR) repeat protein